MSWTASNLKMPALLTSTFGVPRAFFVSSNSRSTSAALDMLARIATARPPLAVISRIIHELEARLGVRLLLRSTRRIKVTDAGALFLERARRVLAEFEEAEAAARGVDSLRGTLRLALPILYGTRWVIPRLPDFL